MPATAQPKVEIQSRPGTQDEEVFREIFSQNIYRLPLSIKGFKVVDVGAHIGCFSISCLVRRAARVWCYEPDAGNFALLQENLAPFLGATVTNASIWRNDRDVQTLEFSGYPAGSNACGSCLPGCTVGGQNQAISVKAVPLDWAILEATDNGKERLDILKIDAEGAEYPALYTSRTLELVDRICGECHDLTSISLGGELVPGFTRYDMDGLAEFLESKKFRVESLRTVDRNSLFWATRIGKEKRVL